MDQELASELNNKESERPQWAKALLKLCDEYKIDLVKNYATNTN